MRKAGDNGKGLKDVSERGGRKRGQVELAKQWMEGRKLGRISGGGKKRNWVRCTDSGGCCSWIRQTAALLLDPPRCAAARHKHTLTQSQSHPKRLRTHHNIHKLHDLLAAARQSLSRSGHSRLASIATSFSNQGSDVQLWAVC